MTSTDLTREARTTAVELTIGGMTCASCAARIEKKLNKIGGVTASVNYAMESATPGSHPGGRPTPQRSLGDDTADDAGAVMLWEPDVQNGRAT